MITINPSGGLCNRMRALDSALALGRAASVPVRLAWSINADLGCPFLELFEPIPGLESVESKIENTAVTSQTTTDFREIAKRLKPLVGFVKNVRKTLKAIRNAGSAGRELGREDTLYYSDKPEKLTALASRYDLRIETFERFFFGAQDYQGFKPTPEITRRVDALSLTARNVVGVHIRRGDSRVAIAHSPIQYFIASMRAKYKADTTTEFFVASDSPTVEDELEREFPGRIIRQPKGSYSREDPVGVKHAMVDLYCLASCRHLIGSYWSSFTDTAYELGKMPWEIVFRSTKGAGRS